MIITQKKFSSNANGKSYFFLNEGICRDMIEYNHLKIKDCIIYISNLNYEQIKKLRIRYIDFALEYYGDFHIDSNNQFRYTHKVNLWTDNSANIKFKLLFLKLSIAFFTGATGLLIFFSV